MRSRKIILPASIEKAVKRSALWLCTLFLILPTCSSQGDTSQIQKVALSFKEAAAECLNTLLYSVTTLEIQTQQVKLIQDSGRLMKETPQAKGLQGFMSLAPEIVGWSGALQQSKDVQTELTNAIMRVRSRLGEINEHLRYLRAELSVDGSQLGTSKNKLMQALSRLQETQGTLEKFLSAIENYAEATNNLRTLLTSMLNELDALSSAGKLSDTTATISRLSALVDQVVANMKKIDDSLVTERASKTSGLASLLTSLTAFESLSDLPSDLRRELEEAVKLIRDVQNGVPFSPR